MAAVPRMIVCSSFPSFILSEATMGSRTVDYDDFSYQRITQKVSNELSSIAPLSFAYFGKSSLWTYLLIVDEWAGWTLGDTRYAASENACKVRIPQASYCKHCGCLLLQISPAMFGRKQSSHSSLAIQLSCRRVYGRLVNGSQRIYCVWPWLLKGIDIQVLQGKVVVLHIAYC